MLPDLAKSRQSGKKVLPDVAKSRQRVLKASKGFQGGFQEITRVSMAHLAKSHQRGSMGGSKGGSKGDSKGFQGKGLPEASKGVPRRFQGGF